MYAITCRARSATLMLAVLADIALHVPTIVLLPTVVKYTVIVPEPVIVLDEITVIAEPPLSLRVTAQLLVVNDPVAS